MRTSPALVAVEAPAEPAHSHADDVIRQLVELIEQVSSGTQAELFDRKTFAGNTQRGPQPVNSSGHSEEVLVDTEVDGYRYLLVRMPRPNRARIQLSPREQEIVRMVAKGHPNKVIADVLNISSWTVCTHLRRIFAKLGVGSRAAMVAQLLEIGALVQEHKER